MKLRVVAALGVMAVGQTLMPALASESARPAIGDTSIFATLPYPGHPFGLALDGNPTPNHNLYVADMNGRILRLALDRDAPAPGVFAQPPAPFVGLGWHATMWNDLVFDPAGNLFMTDDKPRLWRVTPDGQASVWFEDSRLRGLFGFAGGPLGGRIDPTGKFLYFTITISAAFPGEAV